MDYLTVAQIEMQMENLATTYAAICTRIPFLNPTHEGRTAHFLKIAKGTGEDRPAVLIMAGVHAREWAPPDAVVNFVGRLLDAYSRSSPISYPAFTNADGGMSITYPAFQIPWPEVKRIVENLDLYVAPLINPDGRFFSQAVPDEEHMMWRKNRRPHSAGGACIGVDINRNFDIYWDFGRYYTAAAVDEVTSSTDPCHPENYIGPSAASEPETSNVQSVLGDFKITFLVDVHSFGRKILYPWGMEDNQSTNPTMNFQNAEWTFRRDGKGGTYGEYFPNDEPIRLLNQHELLGNRMRRSVLGTAGINATARNRSDYKAEQSLTIYPTTGSSDDYTFSTQFSGSSIPSKFAFTIECGDITEGGFHPDFITQYPKIEREVHAALKAFLSFVATWKPSRSSRSIFDCFIATAVFQSPYDPRVRFLRDLRDHGFKSTEFGRRFMRTVERVYYSFSPGVARYLDQHGAARALARFAVLSPLVWMLRGIESMASRCPTQEQRVAVMMGLLFAFGAGTLAVGVGLLALFLKWLIH